MLLIENPVLGAAKQCKKRALKDTFGHEEGRVWPSWESLLDISHQSFYSEGGLVK